MKNKDGKDADKRREVVSDTGSAGDKMRDGEKLADELVACHLLVLMSASALRISNSLNLHAIRVKKEDSKSIQLPTNLL